MAPGSWPVPDTFWACMVLPLGVGGDQGKVRGWPHAWFWRKGWALANTGGPQKGKQGTRRLAGEGLTTWESEWVGRVL